MSAIFNLNNFSKFAQNQPDAADSFDQSEIDLILKKQSSLITKDEVDQLYKYVKNIVMSNPEDSDINRIMNLFNVLSQSGKITGQIRLAAKEYLKEIINVVTKSLNSKSIIKKNVDVADLGKLSGKDLLNSLVETVNLISKKIVAEKLVQLTSSGKDISKIINEARASLPESKIWGNGLLEYLNKLERGVSFAEKTDLAIERAMEKPIFDAYDFYGVHVPRFLYLYKGSDTSIFHKLSENQDIHHQLNDIFQNYSSDDMSNIKNSYDINRNFGLPIHANMIEWQDGEEVKRSFFLIEVLKHFINVIKNPQNYGKPGESAVWLVVDKFFNNVTRERNFLIAEEIGAGSTRADLTRPYEIERTTIEGMEHYAVTNNFINSLSRKISEFKNEGIMKFLDAIADYSGNNSLEEWATRVSNEINNAIIKFDNKYRNAVAYNSDILGVLYGESVSNFNFIIQRMNYDKYNEAASNLGRHSQDESFASSVITPGGVEVSFHLKAVPISYNEDGEASSINNVKKINSIKMDVNPNDYWKEKISKSFSKELIVVDITVQILNAPIIESGGARKDAKYNSYQVASSQVDIFEKIPIAIDEKSKGYIIPQGSNGKNNIKAFGVPMYSFKDIESLKSFLDKNNNSQIDALLDDARKQISHFLSDSPEVLKGIAGAYIRSRIPLSNIEKANPSHVTRFFQLLEDVKSNYISKLSIVAGGSGLSDEAFECYGSLGRIVLESNIRNLNDKIEDAKKINLNFDNLTKELQEAKDLKKRLDDIFYDFHTPEGEKRPTEIVSTGWKSQKSTLPDWFLRNLINDKKEYLESKDSSLGSGSSAYSYGAKRYEDTRNLINQILMTWNPYELIDLIYVHRINLGPIQEIKEKKKELGLSEDESISDLAPKLSGEVLAKLELEGYIGSDDIEKIGNIFTSTAAGGCVNKCRVFYGAYEKAKNAHAAKTASKTSVAQIEKISSCCDLSKNNIIGYNINDWLRMIARRAYIG